MLSTSPTPSSEEEGFFFFLFSFKSFGIKVFLVFFIQEVLSASTL